MRHTIVASLENTFREVTVSFECNKNSGVGGESLVFTDSKGQRETFKPTATGTEYTTITSNFSPEILEILKAHNQIKVFKTKDTHTRNTRKSYIISVEDARTLAVMKGNDCFGEENSDEENSDQVNQTWVQTISDVTGCTTQ